MRAVPIRCLRYAVDADDNARCSSQVFSVHEFPRRLRWTAVHNLQHYYLVYNLRRGYLRFYFISIVSPPQADDGTDGRERETDIERERARERARAAVLFIITI